ncbi:MULTISPECIES: LysE family translocator, partial [unclassified Aeromonas]
MELTSWLALAAICVMGAISPGPSLALIIRNTVQGGQGHGVATALGHGLGVGIYALITALGLAIRPCCTIPKQDSSLSGADFAQLTCCR